MKPSSPTHCYSVSILKRSRLIPKKVGGRNKIFGFREKEESRMTLRLWFGFLGDLGTTHRNRKLQKQKSKSRHGWRVEEEEGEVIIAVIINRLDLRCLWVILAQVICSGDSCTCLVACSYSSWGSERARERGSYGYQIWNCFCEPGLGFNR